MVLARLSVFFICHGICRARGPYFSSARLFRKKSAFRPSLISDVLRCEGNFQKCPSRFCKYSKIWILEGYSHVKHFSYEAYGGLSTLAFLLLSLSGADGGFSCPHLLHRFIGHGDDHIYPERLVGDEVYLSYQAPRQSRLIGVPSAAFPLRQFPGIAFYQACRGEGAPV